MRNVIVILLAVFSVGAASASRAADMDRRSVVQKSAASVQPIDWAGFYLGAQGGYGWGTSSGTQSADGGGLFPAVPYSIDPRGFLGGGHVGYNYQIKKLVLGIEADVEAAHLDGLAQVDGFGAPRFFNVTADTLASVRGRVGYAHDRVMIYATGGAAFGNVKTPPLDQLDGWRTGWTAGVGAEKKLAGAWSKVSLRIEYRYTDLGRVSQPDPLFNLTDDNALNFHAVRVGLSYHF